jgi:HD-like signal output (HDOD) protein
MKHILFVDDEPRVLEGLHRMLHPQRNRWKMSFANGAEAALTTLETEPVDVIVTDMRMPGTDGATLLEKVRDSHPDVVRLVLSGYMEDRAALRAVPVAHQFLRKPCEPAKLCDAIDRACDLAVILTNGAARRLVTAIGKLPCAPKTYASLVQALDVPDISLHEIAAIVERDVGVSAKILQLVNSAFFGLVREIATVGAAVSYLGLDVLRQLVLSIEVFRTFRPNQHIEGFSLDQLQDHSQLTAALSARLPMAKNLASAAAVASLMHDVGKLVLAVKLPEQYGSALKIAHEEGRPPQDVEEETIGASHAAIGAYLLGLWGLPTPVVEAVYHHHAPLHRLPAGGTLDITAIVHIADALAHEVRAPAMPRPILDLDYLNELGFGDSVSAWREMAAELVQSEIV